VLGYQEIFENRVPGFIEPPIIGNSPDGMRWKGEGVLVTSKVLTQ